MGKNGLKTVLTIGSFFLGAGGANFFGAANHGLMGGMMGVSLMNTIWSATHKQEDTMYGSTSRFDQMMNTVSADSTIPVAYGCRRWAGNQLWHKASTDELSLTKDILVGEGEVHSISEVKFNDIFVGGNNILNVTYTGNSAQATFSKDATKIYLKMGAVDTWAWNDKLNTTSRITHTAETLEYSYTKDTDVANVIAWINQQPSWNAELVLESAVITDIPNITTGVAKNCKDNTVAIVAGTTQNILSIIYNGNDTSAKLAKDATNFSLITSSGTVKYAYSGTELYNVIAWINQQPSWNAKILLTTAVITDIPNFTSANCKGTLTMVKSTAALTGCSYVFNNGGANQVPPDNYDIVGGYRRMSWIRATMKISDVLQGSNPTITYVVKGIKVLDTRTHKVAWSDNPALCVRDFLLSKRYGVSKFCPGMVLDEQSFKEVADYCDELVNYYDDTGALKQEKRYTLNIILDQKQKATEHLDAMFAVFGGFLVNNNGVISLRVEKAENPSYHFDNDSIVENSVSIEQLSLDESPNQYQIGYFDTTQNWTQVKATVNDTVDQQMAPIGKGRVIPKELTLDGCTSQTQALRLGRLYKLKNKLCSLTISWKTSTFAMHLQCGDVVTMTYDKVDNAGNIIHAMVNEPWRIIELSEDNGIWSIKARQYDASIYGDVTESIQVKSYTPIANPLSAPVADVINLDTQQNYRALGDGTVVTDIKVSWASLDTFYAEAEVYMLSNNPSWDEIDVSMDELDGTWEDLSPSTNTWISLGKSTDHIYATNVVKGLAYTFKVVAVNSSGRKADFDNAPTATVTVTGKTLIPKTPTGLTVTFTDNCEWHWDAMDADVDFAELRIDQNPGNPVGLLAKPSTNHTIAMLPQRNGTVYLYTHNASGYYSLPLTLQYAKSALSAPQTVTVTDVFQGFIVTTETLPLYCKGINVHIGDQVFFSPNNVYTFASTGGIYDVSVSFVDIFGNGAVSAVTRKTVVQTLDAALIAEGSLSKAMMDAVMSDAVIKAQNSVSGAVFNNAVNELTQANTTNSSQISQTAKSISDIVTELGKPLDQCSYTAIAQTLTAIGLKVNSTDFTGKNMVTQINLSPAGTTIDGKLLHVTSDTVFDSNVTIKGILGADAIIGANAVFSGSMNFPKNLTTPTLYEGLNLVDDGIYHKTNHSSPQFPKTVSLTDGGFIITDYDVVNGSNWFGSNTRTTMHGRHYTGTTTGSRMLTPDPNDLLPNHRRLNGIFAPRSMPLRDPLINKHSYVSYRVRRLPHVDNNGIVDDNPWVEIYGTYKNMAVVGEIYVPAVPSTAFLPYHSNSQSDYTATSTVGIASIRKIYGAINGANAVINLGYSLVGTGTASVSVMWQYSGSTEWSTVSSLASQGAGNYTAAVNLPSILSGEEYCIGIFIVSKTGTVSLAWNGSPQEYSSTDVVLRNNITLDYHVWEDGYMECGGKSFTF